MAPRRQIKETYSRPNEPPETKGDRRKWYKQRKVIPQFDALFVRNDENKNTSSSCDPFDCLIGDVKKPSSTLDESSKGFKSKSFRKPLGINSFLTNSTFGSVEHSSSNDTFDKLIGKNRRLSNHTKPSYSGFLSSSPSSIDTTGILYNSLRSHSHLHSGVGDKSRFQVVKEEVPAKSPGVSNGTGTVIKNTSVHAPKIKLEQVSPQLFSSDDESRVRKKNNRKVVEPQILPPLLLSSLSSDKHGYRRVCPPRKGHAKFTRKGAKDSTTSSSSEKSCKSTSDSETQRTPNLTDDCIEDRKESHYTCKDLKNPLTSVDDCNAIVSAENAADDDGSPESENVSSQLFSSPSPERRECRRAHPPKKISTRSTRKGDEGSTTSSSSDGFYRSTDDSGKHRTPDLKVDRTKDKKGSRGTHKVLVKPVTDVDVDKEIAFDENTNGNMTPELFKAPLCTGTPVFSNLGKTVINHRFLLSQDKHPTPLQLSGRSQDSGKSSCKSALTSTPLDTSRIKSVSNSFGLWNSVNDEIISPVPREGDAISKMISPSVFESPLSNCLKSMSLSHRKSNGNPSYESHYHTCVSDSCKSNNCSKKAKLSSEGVDPKGGEIVYLNGEMIKIESSSAKVLQRVPIKEFVIPLFDIASELGESPKDELSSADKRKTISKEKTRSKREMHSKVHPQSEVQDHSKSPELMTLRSGISTRSSVSHIKNNDQIDGRDALLSDLSRNLSVEKKKQIKSFLNQPSFSIPLRTRQKRRFSKNKVQPLPVVKRLTRQSSHISRIRNTTSLTRTNAEISNLSPKDNAISDESSEMSYVVPRRGKNNLVTRSTARRMSKLRQNNSSSLKDSIIIPRKSMARGAAFTSFIKPSPILGRRTSVRIALKKKNAQGNTSSLSNKNLSSADDSTSSRYTGTGFVSTRASARKLQNNRKMLSIMQFSLSSVKSGNSEFEESRVSVSSKGMIPDNEMVSFRSEGKPNFSLSSEVNHSDYLRKSSIASSYISGGGCLEDQVIKEEAEDTVISNDNNTVLSTEEYNNVNSSICSKMSLSLKSAHTDNEGEQSYDENECSNAEAEDTSTAKEDETVTSVEDDDVTSRENNDPATTSTAPQMQLGASFLDESVSELDVSLEEDVFSMPFRAPVPIKRGKGWIRSLSIARASLLGSENAGEGVRRQTVHRMSIGGRRMTRLNISIVPETVDASEIEDVDEEHHQLDPLNQSILDDPQRHVLALCSQTEPVPIIECFTESRLSCCKKIGEGVYGEVFMTKPNPHNMDGATVLKIMPIEGNFDVNGEPQKQFHEILSEIIISLELSNLRKDRGKSNWTSNFVHVLNCWCVEGRYHEDMLQLWDQFHEEKGSENDRPDVFPDTQLYIVLEFTHGGRDLEGFVFNNAQQSLSVFLQIAYSLAVAEQELEFEHRDLHWGNVLVATTSESSVDFKISEGTYSLKTQGVMATVIDFTLSRLKAPHCVMFNNLAEDPSLFTAEGDYQFEIYRQMKRVNKNNWQNFTPYTNVLWLHYILDKMINECYYKNVKARIHRNNIQELNRLKNEILDCESATAFVFQREHV